VLLESCRYHAEHCVWSKGENIYEDDILIFGGRRDRGGDKATNVRVGKDSSVSRRDGSTMGM
jgi:hypothetical protein